MPSTCLQSKHTECKQDNKRPVSYTHLDVYKRQVLVLVLYDGALQGGRQIVVGNRSVSEASRQSQAGGKKGDGLSRGEYSGGRL